MRVLLLWHAVDGLRAGDKAAGRCRARGSASSSQATCKPATRGEIPTLAPGPISLALVVVIILGLRSRDGCWYGKVPPSGDTFLILRLGRRPKPAHVCSLSSRLLIPFLTMAGGLRCEPLRKAAWSSGRCGQLLRGPFRANARGAGLKSTIRFPSLWRS